MFTPNPFLIEVSDVHFSTDPQLLTPSSPGVCRQVRIHGQNCRLVSAILTMTSTRQSQLRYMYPDLFIPYTDQGLCSSSIAHKLVGPFCPWEQLSNPLLLAIHQIPLSYLPIYKTLMSILVQLSCIIYLCQPCCYYCFGFLKQYNQFIC